MKHESIILLLILAFSLFACGRSPLLHHSNEITNDQAASLIQQPHKDCASVQWVIADVALCPKISWEYGPALGQNKIRLDFDRDVSEMKFKASAEMPDMGHGTDLVQISRSSDGSSIFITNLKFKMFGRWVVHFSLEDQDRAIEVEI